MCGWVNVRISRFADLRITDAAVLTKSKICQHTDAKGQYTDAKGQYLRSAISDQDLRCVNVRICGCAALRLSKCADMRITDAHLRSSIFGSEFFCCLIVGF